MSVTSEGQSVPGAVGSGAYVVGPDECVGSIAFRHGFFWETLWNHPANAELKRVRKSPFVLLAGDRLTIPELTPLRESCASEARHRFRLKGVPAQIELVLTEASTEGEAPPDYTSNAEGDFETPEIPGAERSPIRNADYVLEVDGVSTTGKTDGEGRLKASIPPDARSGRVRVRPGQPDELVVPLALGRLDPISTWRGVAQRLKNLGYSAGAVPEGEAQGRAPAGLLDAVMAFQRDRGAQPDGNVTGALLSQLESSHKS